MDQAEPRDERPSPMEAPQDELGRRDSLGYALMAIAREPMAILDRDLHVVAASRSYYRMFPAKFAAERSRPFCEPDELRWSAAALAPLRTVIAGDAVIADFEVSLDVPNIGVRRMLLNARRTVGSDVPRAAVLLGLQDITDRWETERLRDELAKQQDVLLQEAHHRIANSLQIIASMLLLKSAAVQSEETRVHLRDVHKRLMLVATVQRQLCSSGMHGDIEFGPYVAQLCQALANAMTEVDGAVTIFSASTDGTIKSDDAVSFGLIIAELVINALKHGFPDGRKGRISVDFAARGADWRLTVSDDGVGAAGDGGLADRSGMGANIVEALARHLRAKVEIATGGIGFSTSIVHTESPAPQAA